MDYETSDASLRAAKRSQLLIWLALTLEPFVYVGLSFIVSRGAISCVEQTAGSYLKWGSYLLACLLAVASLLVNRFFLSDRQIIARLEAERLEIVRSIRYVSGAFVSSGSGWLDFQAEMEADVPDIMVVNRDGDRRVGNHGLDGGGGRHPSVMRQI